MADIIKALLLISSEFYYNNRQFHEQTDISSVGITGHHVGMESIELRTPQS